MRQPLKDLAAICAGQGAPQGDHNYCENGTPFVKAGNLQELLEGKAITSIQKVSDEVAKKHKLRLYPKGTILFAKSGMSCMKGYIYVLPQSAYVVSHLACITPNEDISEYLRYYFNYHKPNQLVKDAAYPSISLSDVGNLVVDMKPESERNEIVSVLQHTESIITLRQRQLQKLDELVKARFIELFGDPLGNDKGWQKALIAEVCNAIFGGGTPSKSHPEYFAGSIPWVSPKDMKSSVINDSIDHITEEAIAHSTTNLVPANSVLMVIRSGILKHTLPVAVNSLPVTINQDMKAFVPNETVKTAFLLYFFKAIENDVLAGVRGVTADNIDFKAFQKRTIIVPPLALQEQFVAFVTQADKSKVAVQKALDEAQLLFDSLMQKYFG